MKRKRKVERYQVIMDASDSGSEFQAQEEEDDIIDIASDIGLSEKDEESIRSENGDENENDEIDEMPDRTEQTEVDLEEESLRQFENSNVCKEFKALLRQAVEFEVIKGHGKDVPVPIKGKKQTKVSGKSEAMIWDKRDIIKCPFTSCDKTFTTYTGIKYHMEKVQHCISLLFDSTHELEGNDKKVVEELQAFSNIVPPGVYPLEVHSLRYSETLSKPIPVKLLIGKPVVPNVEENTSSRKKGGGEGRSSSCNDGYLPLAKTNYRKFEMPLVYEFAYPGLNHYFLSTRS
jgi:hypothetical protein